MAESADMCCKALLLSSPSHRLLPVLALAASKDKNSKIRQICCNYVAMVSVPNLHPCFPSSHLLCCFKLQNQQSMFSSEPHYNDRPTRTGSSPRQRDKKVKRTSKDPPLPSIRPGTTRSLSLIPHFTLNSRSEAQGPQVAWVSSHLACIGLICQSESAPAIPGRSCRPCNCHPCLIRPHLSNLQLQPPSRHSCLLPPQSFNQTHRESTTLLDSSTARRLHHPCPRYWRPGRAQPSSAAAMTSRV